MGREGIRLSAKSKTLVLTEGSGNTEETISSRFAGKPKTTFENENHASRRDAEKIKIRIMAHYRTQNRINPCSEGGFGS